MEIYYFSLVTWPHMHTWSKDHGTFSVVAPCCKPPPCQDGGLSKSWQIAYVPTWSSRNRKFNKFSALDHFLTAAFAKKPFQSPESVNILKNNPVCQIFEKTIVICFSFHVLCPPSYGLESYYRFWKLFTMKLFTVFISICLPNN